MDLFGRRGMGWSIGDPLVTGLVSDAWRQATEPRRPDAHRLLRHSDRGSQYASDAYQRTLPALGVTCSITRTGCCCDNAAMERFLGSLKHGWTNHGNFAGLDEAKLGVFQSIDLFYTPNRIHQALGYIRPEQDEADHAPVNKVA